jgi:hypothetical protein
MHLLWESRTDGEYFQLWKILKQFLDKFREYYGTRIQTFDYILDSVKDDLQCYSNFRMCIDLGEKVIVALRHVPLLW